MNPFYNPIFASKVLKSYLFDIDRIWNINEDGLEDLKNQRLKKIINYANTVPLYQHLFKRNKVNTEEINNLKDLEKLPIVSKNDFKKYYPSGLIPQKTNKDKLLEISTSGTTGKSLSIFVNIYDVVVGLFGYIRMLRAHDINWRKDKVTIIADFAPHTIESGYFKKGFFAEMKLGGFFKNMQWLDTNSKPIDLIEEINDFSPDFLGGYVGMLGHLAVLKDKGFGKDINPSVIATTGSVIDNKLRKYIENIFNGKIFEAYAATEIGPIAFQCKNKNYHVSSDNVHIEVIDKNKRNIEDGKPGHIVVTKLFGSGTPIIRYNALNDIISLKSNNCNCNISSQLINKIYGRDTLSFYLSNGKILLASSFTQIFSKLLYELKTTKLIDFQITQKEFNDFDIKLVFDDDSLNSNVSNNQIFNVLRDGFRKKIGENINIDIKEVKKIKKGEARIISKVDRRNFNFLGYN